MDDSSDEDLASDDLIRLADAYGVATDYWDWRGVRRPASAATLRSVLTALGADVSSAAATAASLQRRWDDPWRQLLPPCVVTRSGRPTELYVHVDHGAPVRLWIELEDGSTWERVPQVDRLVEPRWVDGRLVGEA
nr:hypothetical protein [Ilumatobacteraceae bacterium]